MLDKLSQLGAIPNELSSERKMQLLASLEAEVGPLPDDYRNLLLHFGGDVEFNSLIKFRSDEPSPWAADDGTDSLELLYGLSSKYGSAMLERFETYKGRIPADWIPIGEAPGGNQVCLRISPLGGAHSVEFWDHESEVGPGLPPHGTGLTRITDTLQDFVSRLTPEDPPENAPRAVKVDLQF
ncbi:SMI1/KNR4 family protein [Burkholderia diffusa]|uniref:SMI1/KNR4 family protein n=1 Tax=Burkholderia diffusa TaxID=488732 RepID=UPI00158A7732|nr:SMI1/KNR4 family protein [Burkholderia diffusa]